jgi:hypothetical protein
MVRAFEGVIESDGTVHLLEPVSLDGRRRAVVMVLDDQPRPDVAETALLSEASLGQDWNRPEEDAAWAYLQSETS